MEELDVKQTAMIIDLELPDQGSSLILHGISVLLQV